MQLHGRQLGNGRIFICAEIGQNHNGDVYHASRLIQEAEQCGVDAVKLQARDRTYEHTTGALPYRLTEAYSGPHSYGATYGEHRAHLDLTTDDLDHIKNRHGYNENKSLLFTTVCSPRWVEWCEDRNWCPVYKIASKDIWNDDLLRAVASTGKPVIISSGHCKSLDDVERRRAFFDDVLVCHTVSDYPTQLRQCALGVLDEWRQRLGCPIGWSDHTGGLAAATAAAVLGYDYLEVHFTKNRAQKGRDHAASLEPAGLRTLVSRIRDMEIAIGERNNVRTERREISHTD